MVEWGEQSHDFDYVWLCQLTIAMSWETAGYRRITQIGRENESGGLNGRHPDRYWRVFAYINVTCLREASGGHYREPAPFCDTDVGA